MKENTFLIRAIRKIDNSHDNDLDETPYLHQFGIENETDNVLDFYLFCIHVTNNIIDGGLKLNNLPTDNFVRDMIPLVDRQNISKYLYDIMNELTVKIQEKDNINNEISKL